MKVLHVIDSLGFGGAERSLSFYLPELAKLGPRLEIACFQKANPEVPTAGEIPIRYFPGPAAAAPKKKRAWLRQVCAGADLVHTHLNHSTLLAREALAGSPTPTITTLHNIWYGDAQMKTYPWPGRWKVGWMRWREKRTLGPGTFLLAVSQSVADVFRQYAGLTPDRISIISNAIHPLFFQEPAPKPLQTRPAGPVIAVGRLVPEKNHMLILRALQGIPYPIRPKVEIFGQGPLQAKLRNLAKDAQVDLSMPGITSDLHRLLPEKSLFINPSKLEGQALVVLEAMASGLPCLLSDIPPHKEVAGDCALYFPPDDADACGRALQRLLDSPELQLEMGTRARARSEIARPATVARRLFDYYHAVLAGKVPGARSGDSGSPLPPP